MRDVTTHVFRHGSLVVDISTQVAVVDELHDNVKVGRKLFVADILDNVWLWILVLFWLHSAGEAYMVQILHDFDLVMSFVI